MRKQLLAIMDRYKLDLVTAGRNFNKIRMAVASGALSVREHPVCARDCSLPILVCALCHFSVF